MALEKLLQRGKVALQKEREEEREAGVQSEIALREAVKARLPKAVYPAFVTIQKEDPRDNSTLTERWVTIRIPKSKHAVQCSFALRGGKWVINPQSPSFYVFCDNDSCVYSGALDAALARSMEK